jgi:hypothetical protein
MFVKGLPVSGFPNTYSYVLAVCDGDIRLSKILILKRRANHGPIRRRFNAFSDCRLPNYSFQLALKANQTASES